MNMEGARVVAAHGGKSITWKGMAPKRFYGRLPKVRVQAIRSIPLFCKDTPEHLAKIIDILAQSLVAGENVERDAVNKALMTLLRQEVKTLFKHVGSSEERGAEELSTDNIREKVTCYKTQNAMVKKNQSEQVLVKGKRVRKRLPKPLDDDVPVRAPKTARGVKGPALAALKPSYSLKVGTGRPDPRPEEESLMSMNRQRLRQLLNRLLRQRDWIFSL